jgi:uncharacterized Zn finger protein (UPF0148 family)
MKRIACCQCGVESFLAEHTVIYCNICHSENEAERQKAGEELEAARKRIRELQETLQEWRDYEANHDAWDT